MNQDEVTISPLAAEARRLLDAGALGRSDVLVRLFDFLLECSLDDRAPKEIEIAQVVFGRSDPSALTDDASVRVYIHRLRRKIDEFYSGVGPEVRRLAIPRGEYRLVLEQADPSEAAVAPPEAAAASTRRIAWPTGLMQWGLLGLLVLVGVAGGILWANQRPKDAFSPFEHTNFWRSFEDARFPKLLVFGDYYIFGEAQPATGVTRLLREFQINSREDLDTYVMERPQLFGRYVNLDLHYLPISTVQAMQSLLPVATAGAKRGNLPLRLSTMSDLTAERLKNTSLVYVGLLSGLGLLLDPVFNVSGFSIGGSYDELVDRTTKHHYLSDWSQVANGGRSTRDYAYLASFRGPTGNRILIIAGTRDAAVMQAADAATDPTQLAVLAKRTNNAAAFEALYEVHTMGNVDLDSALVLARPLRDDIPWRAGTGASQQFPDQFQARSSANPPAR